jgi:hypothetical protein
MSPAQHRLASIALLGVAIYVADQGWGRAHRAHLRTAWPVARGILRGADIVRVSVSTTRRPHSYYEPRLTYSYQVGGERYVGTRLSYEEPNSASRAQLEHRLAAFRVGDSLWVHYDPAAPQRSTLEVGGASDGVGLMILTPFILLVAFLEYMLSRAEPADAAA